MMIILLSGRKENRYGKTSKESFPKILSETFQVKILSDRT